MSDPEEGDGGNENGGSGSCACGEIRYSVSGRLRPVVNCHCHRCRRITGHHMAATSAQQVDLHLAAERTLKWFEVADGVFYGFCGECGSSLFWRNDAEPDRVSICAGTLDPPTGLATTKALWMAEISDYHTPPAGLIECAYDS